jgi:hypothetical protein
MPNFDDFLKLDVRTRQIIQKKILSRPKNLTK